MDDRFVLVDTNVLLSASTPARVEHGDALRVLNEWPNEGFRLCTSGQILREYLVVATRPLDQNGLAFSREDAASNVDALQTRMRLLNESPAVFARLRRLLDEVQCSGNQIHDANVVATALTHGVARICTGNVDDFERFNSYVEVVALSGV